MKQSRIISMVLAALMTSALCVPALAEDKAPATDSAEMFTCKIGAYSFAVPEGWFAVDASTVDEVLADEDRNDTLGDEIRKNLANAGQQPVTLLYQNEVQDGSFINSIQITIQELPVNATTKDMMDYKNMWEDPLKKSLPGWKMAQASKLTKVGDREVIALNGTYKLANYKLQFFQMHFVDVTTLCTLSMFASDKQAKELEPALAAIAETLTVQH